VLLLVSLVLHLAKRVPILLAWLTEN
jgi:hypothetical protein